MNNYRSEIDGLRAVAVTAVILFHAAIPGFEGGFLGVDIFFVVSGFLVGGAIVDSVKRNQLSFIDFYMRRARRIFPALSVMLLVTFGTAWFVLPPLEMKLLSEGLGTSSLFLSNFYYLSTTGYFGPDAKTNFLIHTWSLSVEEQFYTIFPVVASILFLAIRQSIDIAVICLVICSFLLAYTLSYFYPSEVFYFSPARAWQLMLGTAAANIKMKPDRRWSWAGAIIIVIGFLTGQQSQGFPDTATVLVSIGTVVFLIYATNSSGIGKLLSFKLNVWIGLISYSLYLWHQPVFVYFRVGTNFADGALQTVFMLVFTVALAFLSYRLIEQPFRKSLALDWSPRSILGAYIFPLIVLFTVGLIGALSNGFPSRVSEDVLIVSSVQSERSEFRQDCNYGGGRSIPTHPINACMFAPIGASKASVMIVGDSHADALGAALIPELTTAGFSAYLATAGGCLPAPGVRFNIETTHARDCEDFMTTAYDFAASSDEQIIILVGRWSNYLGTDRPRDVANAIAAQISTLARIKRVVLVDPIPEMDQHIPSELISRAMRGAPLGELSIPIDAYNERNSLTLTAFDAINEKILRISPKDLFCSEQLNRCIGSDDRKIFYRDDNHLSFEGAMVLSKTIVDQINRLQSVSIEDAPTEVP